MRKRMFVFLAVVILLLTSAGTMMLPVAGAADYNYTDAMAKSILFYEVQWCGPDAGNNRIKWRGPCHTTDGADVGVDLTGGFHDCGDHVKFGLPEMYAASTLGWAYYEFKDTYVAKGQDGYLLNILKHFTDYIMKCFVNDTTFYYQCGDGDTDHSYWGPPEMQKTSRPTFYVGNPSTPASDVAGDAAAALALMYLNYKDKDPAYATTCLNTAKRVYTFGKTYRGNSKGQNYYTPQSYYDEMMWGAIWLSVATGDQTYLNDVETFMTEKGIGGDQVQYYNHWTHCWDDVYGGVALKMAQLTGKAKYITTVEENLSYWMTQLQTTPGGMKFLHQWGPLKYCASESMLALVYNKTKPTQSYVDFAKRQIDYILGTNPNNMSYLVGFGANYPKFPHNRAASGRYEPGGETKKDPERHICYGAMVGGPDVTDKYVDDIDQYVYTETGLDYGAGLVGALAGMSALYGASQLPEQTPGIEGEPDQCHVEAQVTYENNQQTVVKAYVYYISTTPPHFETNLTMRYFVDLTEFYNKGYTVSNVTSGIDYTSNGAKISGLLPWDEAKHIYYVEISWVGIQLFGVCQVQFKVNTQSATCWDQTNDFSRNGLGNVGGALVTTQYLPLYKSGALIYGSQPGNNGTPTPTRQVTPTPTQPATATPTPTRVGTTATPTRRVTATPSRRVTPTRRGPTNTPTPTQRGTTPTSTNTPTQVNTPTPTRSGGNYVVNYAIQSDWGNGATMNVTITNNTTGAVNGWTLAFTFPGNQTISNLWNGSYTQSGASVSVKDAGYNANIPAGGGSVNFGFNLNYSGSNAKPTAFTLNGNPCQTP